MPPPVISSQSPVILLQYPIHWREHFNSAGTCLHQCFDWCSALTYCTALLLSTRSSCSTAVSIYTIHDTTQSFDIIEYRVCCGWFFWPATASLLNGLNWSICLSCMVSGIQSTWLPCMIWLWHIIFISWLPTILQVSSSSTSASLWVYMVWSFVVIP